MGGSCTKIGPALARRLCSIPFDSFLWESLLMHESYIKPELINQNYAYSSLIFFAFHPP